MIAAVVIGGTGLYGGQGKICTIIGVIIIALTRNLNLAASRSSGRGFATGAIIPALSPRALRPHHARAVKCSKTMLGMNDRPRPEARTPAWC